MKNEIFETQKNSATGGFSIWLDFLVIVFFTNLSAMEKTITSPFVADRFKAIEEKVDRERDFELAQLFYYGRGIQKDYDKALEFLEKVQNASLKDDFQETFDYYKARIMYEKGEYEKAEGEFEKLKSAKNEGVRLGALYYVARILLDTGSLKDKTNKLAEARAKRKWTSFLISLSAADKLGDSERAAKFDRWEKLYEEAYFGMLYCFGSYLFVDDNTVEKETAVRYFELACNQNVNREAQAGAWYFLGRMHLEGKGVRKEYEKAFEYLQKAAEQNDYLWAQASAMVALAELSLLYGKPQRIAQSDTGFSRWLKEAQDMIIQPSNVRDEIIFNASKLLARCSKRRKAATSLVASHKGNVESSLLDAAKKGEEELVHSLISRAPHEVQTKTLLSLAKFFARGGTGMPVDPKKAADYSYESFKRALDYFRRGATGIELPRLLIKASQLFNNRSRALKLLEKNENKLNESLFEACKDGDAAVVEILIAMGANIEARDAEGQTPLYVACYWGKYRAAKLLLKKGTNIEARHKDGWSPLNQACATDCTELIRLLLVNGADKEVAVQGWTPLYSACSSGKVAAVHVLLNHAVNIRDTDIDVARKQGFKEIVNVLEAERKRRAGQREGTNNNGETALHLACFYGNFEKVEQLVEDGADIEAIEKYGRTPLHFASDEGHEKIVELLTEKGADLNKKNGDDGWTPLHWACKKGRLNVVQVLVNKGAERKIKDGNGKIPLDIAREQGFEEVVKVLEANK